MEKGLLRLAVGWTCGWRVGDVGAYKDLRCIDLVWGVCGTFGWGGRGVFRIVER